MRDVPVTAAVRALRAAKVAFEGHLYDYREKGGTARSSAELGVDEHIVVKTLVMEDDRRKALVVLMHGDREVSTKKLARDLGAKSIAPCDPKTAEKHSGYLVGGTSPFGLKTALPIYVERTILELPRIFINGGKRGFLVSLAPADMARALALTPVEVAQPG
jgi:Cys-tRNA(Pro) deacylase